MPASLVDALERRLQEVGDDGADRQMAASMKDESAFLVVKTP